MKLVNTAKLRLYVTPEQAKQFDLLMKIYSEACSEVSTYSFQNRIYTNTAKLNQDLYEYIRNKYQLKAQLTQSVFKTVAARYKSIKTQMQDMTYTYTDVNTKKKYKVKKNLDWLVNPVNFKRPQADLVRNRDYSFTEDMKCLSVQTLNKRIKVKYSKKGFEHFFDHTWTFGTAKLVKSGNKYFLHISVSKDIEDLNVTKAEAFVGTDRGLINLSVSYDSNNNTQFVNGSDIANKRNTYYRTRRSLQSKNTKGSKKVLKRLSGRENRWMNDVNHCLTKALVGSYPSGTVFGIEDLSGVLFDDRTNNNSKDNRRELHSWSFYDWEIKLIYKANKNGSIVVKFNPQYTSQRCPKCGKIDKTARNRNTHTYTCKSCGFTENDDKIAAMNILELTKRYISGEANPFYKIELPRTSANRG